MTTLALSVMLQVSAISLGAQDYQQAYQATTETGRPLVVMVGADWCGPCQKMKHVVLPEVKRAGVLDKVEFTFVDADSKLAKKLMRGGSIPQLIVFRRGQEGWARQQINGVRSADEVGSFLNAQAAASEVEGRPVTRLSSH